MKLKKLRTKVLAKNVLHYKTIDSTQSEVWRLINKNAPSGTIVIADIQTAGKGTHGRIWHTDNENNIAFSFFVQLDCNISKLTGITTKIAEIILQTFKEIYNIYLNIKSPNDIMYNNKKLGGILTETKIVGENVKYLVVGIGINTSQLEFADDIKDIATSIKKEFNIDVDTQEVIAEICNKIEEQIINKLRRD